MSLVDGHYLFLRPKNIDWICSRCLVVNLEDEGIIGRSCLPERRAASRGVGKESLESHFAGWILIGGAGRISQEEHGSHHQQERPMKAPRDCLVQIAISNRSAFH